MQSLAERNVVDERSAGDVRDTQGHLRRVVNGYNGGIGGRIEFVVLGPNNVSLFVVRAYAGIQW